MEDREFINNLIKVYFSNAKEPHQATLDNAITNRLNDIANKLEEQKEVLEILKPYFQGTVFPSAIYFHFSSKEFEPIKRWAGNEQ